MISGATLKRTPHRAKVGLCLLTSPSLEYPLLFDTRYWRASETGQQSIRIIFDEPQSLRNIRLVLKEAEHERTQEFSISWSCAAGGATKEILRQRWNFSPTGSTTEVENYDVDLSAVSALELVIQPDVARADAFATVDRWCVR